MNDCLTHTGDPTRWQGLLQNSQIRLADRQPYLFNEDEPIAVIFNGEDYNYKSVREEFTESNHQFETDTAIGIFVHSYEEWATTSLVGSGKWRTGIESTIDPLPTTNRNIYARRYRIC